MDIDNICLRPLSELLDFLEEKNAQNFVVRESEWYFGPFYFANGIFGGYPGSFALFLLILKWFETMETLSERVIVTWIVTGPVVLTETLMNYESGWKFDSIFLNSSTFFPVHYEDLLIQNTSYSNIINYANCKQSFAMHFWDKRQVMSQ